MSATGIPLFSSAEIAERHKTVRDMMDRQGVAALLVFGHSGRRRHYQADVYYMTNVAPQHECYFFFPKSGEPVLFITHYNHLASAKEISTVTDVRRCGKRPAAQIAKEIKSRNLSGPIGLVGTFAYQDIDVLRKESPSAGWSDLSAEFRDIRTRKSAVELEFQWKAAAACDAVIKAFTEAIRPGVEERDLLVLSEEVAWKSGCEPDFLYLNSTPMKNSESCVPNQNISRRKLEMGDVINTELTVAYGYYSAQILRPFFLGDLTKEYQRLYDVAKGAHDRMVAIVKPGTTAQQIHETSGYIEECGFTAIDGVAHGFGIDLLPPSIRSKSYDPPLPFTLEKDMTLVIQPNPTTHDEKMGVQLGEMLLITDSGSKSMHASSAEAIFCG
jgi:Xaa-Pro aminopeptidase